MALTKHIHDEALKNPLAIEDIKVEVIPKILDNSLAIAGARIIPEPAAELNSRTVKPKVTAKKTKLGRALSQLYNLEASNKPDKLLNLDLDLYQMENF